MTEWLHPAFLMLMGALALPLLRGVWQKCCRYWCQYWP